MNLFIIIISFISTSAITLYPILILGIQGKCHPRCIDSDFIFFTSNRFYIQYTVFRKIICLCITVPDFIFNKIT